MKKRGLLKSTGIFSANTLLSRVLGFVRDMLVAQIFGAGVGYDAFIVAFKLPNFMRRLFAEGAFSQAFVPILSEYQSESEHQAVRLFIDRIAGSLGSVLFIFTLLAMLFAPLLVRVFAPGFHVDDPRFLLASHMLRITFPYLMFISLTALCSAVLNTYGRYGIPAFTPVLLNVCLIVAAAWWSHHMAIPIYAMAWGVFIAGIIQLLFQLPFLARMKLMPRPKLGFHDPGVRRVLKLMVPALFGVSVAQISLLIDTMFASFLPVGSVTWLYLSDRLMNFPLGVFGVAIATVILPFLSRSHAKKSEAEYSKTLDWALRLLFLIGVPASIALLILSGPLLATLLHYGRFDDFDVRMTRESLMAFAFGVQGFMLIKVLASGFYAKQNIKTPVKIAAVAMCANIILNFILIFPLKHAGLALATTLSGYLNAGLLLTFLLKRRLYTPESGWLKYAVQLGLANLLMAVFLFFTSGHLGAWLLASWEWRILHLLMLVFGGIIIYFAALFISGVRFNHFRRVA
jgi:putative peptidoglycan lipid II flippase